MSVTEKDGVRAEALADRMTPELIPLTSVAVQRSGDQRATQMVAPVTLEEDRADASAGLSPAKLLHAFRRRWYLAIPIAALVAAAVYWYADNRLTPTFTARTLLQVSARQQTLLTELGGGRENVAFQRTQIATIKMRIVIETAIRDLEPLQLSTLRGQANPVAWLEKEVQADYSMSPEILRITLKGSDQDETRVILNAVRESYLREILNKDHTDRVTWLAKLSEVSTKREADLTALRRKLNDRAETFGARDLAALRVKYDHAIGRIATLQTELLHYRAELRRTQLMAAGKEDDSTPDPELVDAALERAFVADPLAVGLRKDIATLEVKTTNLEQTLRDYTRDAAYIAQKKELAETRQELAKRRDKLREVAYQQAQDALKAQRTKDVATQARMLAAAKEAIPERETEIAKSERDTLNLSRGIAELELVQHDVAQLEDRVKQANARAQAIEDELRAPPRARVLEEATIVETPKSDRYLKFVVAPTAVVFFLVLLGIAWLDVRSGRVDGGDDFGGSQLKILGAVPWVRQQVIRTFTPPTKTNQEYQRLADALDTTRTVLTATSDLPALATLVVTSATAGEGKTILATHLAARFARSGRRTLLIDTDIRRPRIQSLLGLPLGPGFGEGLLGRYPSSQVAHPTEVPGLDVMTVGLADIDTVRNALDRRLAEFLADIRQTYDVVVFDTAPVLAAPESLTICRIVDGVLLSVMRDVSRVPGVLAASELLRSVNARVLGAVVTGESSSPQVVYYS